MKKYNNLFDSIIMTILSLISFLFGCCLEYFGVISNDKNINKIVTSFIIISFCGFMTIVSLFLIFKYCYEKWWIEEDAICSKKLLHKQNKILFNDIESISEGIVSALIFETFKSDAIIIKGKGNSKIIILKTKYVQKNKIYEIIKSKIKTT